MKNYIEFVKKYYNEEDECVDEDKLLHMDFSEKCEMIEFIFQNAKNIKYDGDKSASYIICVFDDCEFVIVTRLRDLYSLEDSKLYKEVAKYLDSIINLEIFEQSEKLPIAILNTTILTNDGVFALKTVSIDEIKTLIKGADILSAVGHQTTADVLTELLNRPVPMNRIQYAQNVGETAICFKLNGRPEEGKILTKEEIESIGYEFKILTRIE